MCPKMEIKKIIDEKTSKQYENLQKKGPHIHTKQYFIFLKSNLSKDS